MEYERRRTGLAITATRPAKKNSCAYPGRSSNDRCELCADPVRVKQAIEQARQAKGEDETWPQLHYLWPQHPIVEWLVDRVITLFGRHRAPVIQSHHLQPGKQAFVMLKLVPNRKGQPLLVDWQVACRYPRRLLLEPYEAFVQRAGLKATARYQIRAECPVAGHASGLAEAACMRQHMVQRQAAFAVQMQQRHRAHWRTWSAMAAQVQQLELRLAKQLEQIRRSQFERRSRVIERVFDEYRHCG